MDSRKVYPNSTLPQTSQLGRLQAGYVGTYLLPHESPSPGPLSTGVDRSLEHHLESISLTFFLSDRPELRNSRSHRTGPRQNIGGHINTSCFHRGTRQDLDTLFHLHARRRRLGFVVGHCIGGKLQRSSNIDK